MAGTVSVCADGQDNGIFVSADRQDNGIFDKQAVWMVLFQSVQTDRAMASLINMQCDWYCFSLCRQIGHEHNNVTHAVDDVLCPRLLIGCSRPFHTNNVDYTVSCCAVWVNCDSVDDTVSCRGQL